MAALLRLPARVCVGVRVCAHVTLPLSSLLHPYSKNIHPKIWESLDGWRGALDLGWQRRIPSAPPSLPVAHTQRDAPRAPHPHVPVLFGGCSWFSRRLSHSSDPNRPWGSRMCWDCPWEHFVSSQGGTAQLLSGTCLAWKEEALSPLSARENCPLLPACQAWLKELALAPAVQGELWCQELALGER